MILIWKYVKNKKKTGDKNRFNEKIKLRKKFMSPLSCVGVGGHHMTSSQAKQNGLKIYTK